MFLSLTKSKTLCLKRNLSLAVRVRLAFPNRPRVQQISDNWPSVVCLCLGASVNRSVSVVALTMQAKSIVGHACADLQIRNPVRPRRWESSVWSAGSDALSGRPFHKVGRAGGGSVTRPFRSSAGAAAVPPYSPLGAKYEHFSKGQIKIEYETALPVS